MKKTAQQRVQNGIAWLDSCKAVPDNWRSLLDIDGLRFANPDRGPLGQLFDNDYGKGLHACKIVGGASQMGFRSRHQVAEDPKELSEEWKFALRTEDKWTVYGNTSSRFIRGVRYVISREYGGKFKITECRGTGYRIFPNEYANTNNAKRAVRKLVEGKLV